jgi:hypothetical protein
MRLTAGLLALGLVLSGPALAQVAAPSLPDTNSAPPDKIGPPLDQHPVPQTGTAAPLSKELSRTDGVVHPPSTIDPGMTQTPPNPGARSMPVIKPPTPDSGVAPK